MVSLGTCLKIAHGTGSWKERRIRESCLIPKDLNSRNINPKEQNVTQKWQEAYRDEKGDPGKTQTQKESIQNEEAGRGRLKGVQRHCLSMLKCSQESQTPPGAKTSEECQE